MVAQKKLPAIPSVPPTAPPDLTMFLNSVKSAIDVIAGDTAASGVTLEELDAILREYALTGDIGGTGGTLLPPSGGGGTTPEEPDTTPPPAPTGLLTTGGFSTIVIEWDALPSSPPIAFTTIYRAAVDNFSLAIAVGTSRTLLYADYVPDSQNYYYWITFTSEAGIEGPVNAAAGTLGNASLDPSYTKQVLANAITDLEIADKALTDGSIADAAVIRELIANLAIDGTKLADLAVDTAKIVDGAILSAKIADLAVGTAKIADAAILSAKIADAAIITAKIDTAAIVTAHIQDAAIIDAKILNLGADKIVAASLSAVSANLGQVTAGRMESPDGTFLIDLSGKEIIITGPQGQALDDYTVIRNGDIEAYEYTGTGHQLAKALRGLQTGIASNGARVTIPGYFRNQPRIIVSPANLPSYLVAFQDQDQTMQCIARSISETLPGSGSWQFDAVAQLVVAGGTEVQTPGLSFADSQIDDQYLTGVTTLSVDVTQLSLLTKVRTYQSTGTSGIYLNRQVTASLEYSVAGANSWVVGDTATVQINQEATYVDINLETGTLPQNQYDVRLRYVFVNTGGTYNGAGGSLEPRQETVFGPANQTINRNGAGTTTDPIDTGAWSPPAGATGISVNYSYNWSATATVEYLFATGVNSSVISGLGGTTQEFLSVSINAANPEPNPKIGNANGSYAAQGSGSYDQNFLSGRVVNQTAADGSAEGTLTVTGAQATIDYQVPAPTDTDPHNFATWDTLVATLAGSTVLSEGTVNWLAIGES